MTENKNTRKWKEVFERLPIERKNKSLTEISGFTNFCEESTEFRNQVLNYLSSELPKNSLHFNVCEVGCGCGDKLSFFYNKDYSCYGLDYSENMIKRAKEEMPQATLYTGEACKLPFEDNSMNFIFSYSVFLYFESEEYTSAVLSEIYRVAKPNALICIWDVPDIQYKEAVLKLRGSPEEGYQHAYYDINYFMQWFKQKEIKSIKAEYTPISVYKLSNYRFNITVKLNKNKKT
jgi:ubiquinone/menaquinone biosynthesis C-methylase UbiE